MECSTAIFYMHTVCTDQIRIAHISVFLNFLSGFDECVELVFCLWRQSGFLIWSNQVDMICISTSGLFSSSHPQNTQEVVVKSHHPTHRRTLGFVSSIWLGTPHLNFNLLLPLPNLPASSHHEWIQLTYSWSRDQCWSLPLHSQSTFGSISGHCYIELQFANVYLQGIN